MAKAFSQQLRLGAARILDWLKRLPPRIFVLDKIANKLCRHMLLLTTYTAFARCPCVAPKRRCLGMGPMVTLGLPLSNAGHGIWANTFWLLRKTVSLKPAKARRTRYFAV